MGHLREDLPAIDPTLRFFSVYSYLIIYCADTDPLEVVRVLHGARDVRRILEG
jgi:plasmid stabilization system protein ParE